MIVSRRGWLARLLSAMSASSNAAPVQCSSLIIVARLPLAGGSIAASTALLPCSSVRDVTSIRQDAHRASHSEGTAAHRRLTEWSRSVSLDSERVDGQAEV